MPRWNDETFKIVNERSKQILKSEIKTYTHHIATENFGTEQADNIYKSSKCKANTDRAIVTNNDINDILTSSEKSVKLHAYILLEDILKELKRINRNRQLEGLPYNTISPGCIKFIKSTLQNIPETKRTLEQLRISIYIFRERNY